MYGLLFYSYPAFICANITHFWAIDTIYYYFITGQGVQPRFHERKWMRKLRRKRMREQHFLYLESWNERRRGSKTNLNLVLNSIHPHRYM